MSTSGSMPLDNRYVRSSDSGTDDDSGSDSSENHRGFRLPNQQDRQLLRLAEEQENLISRPGRSGGARNLLIPEDATRRRRKQHDTRARRIRQHAEGGGNAELIYEMESGYKDNSSRSSRESLTLMDEKWNQEPKSKLFNGRTILVILAIIGLFALLSYGSYRASKKTTSQQILSNGTHIFGPTTIMISLDGFRADFLQRGLTPALKAIIESGVSPKYMLPSFPSLTFPNHFTLVTGLYPESHGIVGNQFWDPNIQEEFYYTNISNSMQSKWWDAEPVWVTAEKAGLKTAIHMWPGSEAHIGNRDPTYLDKYNGSETLEVKVNRILQWLDLPKDDRPQFIGAYVPNVDADGHKYGPNSTQIRATIVEVDSMLTSLIEGLFDRNLTEVVNIVIVSDHGMATTSNDRLVQLDDLIDMSLVDHIDGWPLSGLRLKNPDRDVPVLYQKLLAASKKDHFDVYTLDTMPERYHFTKNERIAPLWVVPQAGWAVVTKQDFDIAEAQATGRQYSPLGLHGYDHEHPLMRAIFVARGPAFPHPPNSRVAAFQNTEVYNIICDSLRINPVSNNGTLRLPLVTQGFHGDEPPEVPADPIDSLEQVHPTVAGVSSTQTSVLVLTGTVTSTSNVTPTGQHDVSTKDQDDSSPEAHKTTHSNWWDFLHNKLEKAKEWAKELIDSIRNNVSDKISPTR